MAEESPKIKPLPVMTPKLRLLAVGDVHGDLDECDLAFLDAAAPDLVVFVGDLADEDLGIVSRLAGLKREKAVILGNHDAWRASRGGPLDTVRNMLQLLGRDHLGYATRELGETGYRVVGARPFSWGGTPDPWPRLIRDLYGLTTAEESVERLVTLGGAEPLRPLIWIAHNGPTGLGIERDAPFGRDFRDPALDFGDPDLGTAILRLSARGVAMPLCLAGHMHDRLFRGGQRRRVAFLGETLVVNAAVVPRWRPVEGEKLRHCVEVVLEDGGVSSVADLWYGDDQEVRRREPLMTRGCADRPR